MTNWVPAYALTDRELWNPKLVMNALVFAQRVSRAAESNDGPRAPRAAWPESPDEEETLDPDEERLRPTRLDVTRAGWIFRGFTTEDGRAHPGWLNVLDQPSRKVLQRWSVWASHGKMFQGIAETEEEYARRQHMSHAALRWQRDLAAKLIAISLNEAGLKVWHTEKPRRKANRQVAQSA